MIQYLVQTEKKEKEKAPKQTDQVGSWYVLPYKCQNPILKAVGEAPLCFTEALNK